MYLSMFNQVWPVLVLLAVIAIVAPKVPDWAWKVINIVTGICLTAFGGLVAFMAISTGGDPKAGPAVLLAFAGGAAWTATWLLYYWESRTRA